jgi:predicted small secreted protein
MRRFARLMMLILAPPVLLAACQREGTAERTGRSIDRGVDQLTR